jgi:hypothetical protein
VTVARTRAHVRNTPPLSSPLQKVLHLVRNETRGEAEYLTQTAPPASGNPILRLVGPDDLTTAPEPRFRHLVLPAAIVVLGALLRGWNIASESLSLDEINDSQVLTQGWVDAARAQDGFPALHALLAKPFLVMSADPMSQRYLSLLAGIAAMVGIYLVLRAVDNRGALGGLSFVAFHPLTVQLGREARPYGLSILFSAGLVVAIWRLLQRATTLRWILFGLFASGLAGMTYTGAYYAAVAFLATSIALGRRVDPPRLIRSMSVVLVTASPFVLLMLATIGRDIDYQQSLAVQTVQSSLTSAAGYTFHSMLGGLSLGPPLLVLRPLNAVDRVRSVAPYLLIELGVWVLLAYSLMQRRSLTRSEASWFTRAVSRRSHRESPATAVDTDRLSSEVARLLSVVAVVPLLIGLFAAYAIGIDLRPRHFVSTVVFMAVPAGLAISRFRPWLRTCFLGGLITLFGVAQSNQLRDPQYRNVDYRSAAKFLSEERVRFRSVLVIAGYSTEGLEAAGVQSSRLIPGPSAAVDIPRFLGNFSTEVRDEGGCSMIVVADAFNVDPAGQLGPITASTSIFDLDPYGVELEFSSTGISVFSTNVCVTERSAIRASSQAGTATFARFAFSVGGHRLGHDA